MSIFNELLPKIKEISNAYVKNFNDDLKAAFACLDKFEEEYQNERGRARDKIQKDKNPMTTLQRINEIEDEPIKPADNNTKAEAGNDSGDDKNERSSTENPRRASKKRSKNEVDGINSPEPDKRQKRNASVKAKNIIAKQVNLTLNQKLRRDASPDKSEIRQSSRSRRHNDNNKENSVPIPVVQIKQEKISIPLEPMDLESLPLDVEQEIENDKFAMPPPAAPVPKPRKGIAQDKPQEDSSEDKTSVRRSTRMRKQTDMPPVAATRSLRASSRAARQTDSEEQPPQETRPKRTRNKKKLSESSTTDVEKGTQSSQESTTNSPAHKPRPKRTKRLQKAAEEEQKQEGAVVSPKEERQSKPELSSPILQKETKTKTQKDKKEDKQTYKKADKQTKADEVDLASQSSVEEVATEKIELEETRVILNQLDATVTISKDLDMTVVLPNGVYSHAPVTPTVISKMNETVVIEAVKLDTNIVTDNKPQNVIMDATVVIDKDPKASKITDDNSLLTDDDTPIHEPHTPPTQEPPKMQPTSAVKEKVQQFEELASRVTRTKTRAMAKKAEDSEKQTPPDKISKPVLSVETLSKMNNLIFNGKAPQTSVSATKPRAIPTTMKSHGPSTTSKISAINKAKEAAEESLKRDKEDARKKKEALLEAKRELQRKKREEKMAAAAAARVAAERERRLAAEASARERREKQAHADQGRADRMREQEKKKQDLARKVAETEERRKAEEQARHQRLAEEQRKADALRRKQIEEAEATKKEAAIMAREIEKRQKEYTEKQKKQRHEDKMHTPLKIPSTPGSMAYTMEPVYMADGFQYLNSDEDEEPAERPVPDWSTSRARKQHLHIQMQIGQEHVDRLFSVRVHSPDLREIFPGIERNRLKRTSSAVWRTPPGRMSPLPE